MTKAVYLRHFTNDCNININGQTHSGHLTCPLVLLEIVKLFPFSQYFIQIKQN